MAKMSGEQVWDWGQFSGAGAGVVQWGRSLHTPAGARSRQLEHEVRLRMEVWGPSACMWDLKSWSWVRSPGEWVKRLQN